jgi:hypothetical protein
LSTKLLSGNLDGVDNLRDVDVDGRIILKEQSLRVMTGCNWLRIRSSVHGNEVLSS